MSIRGDLDDERFYAEQKRLSDLKRGLRAIGIEVNEQTNSDDDLPSLGGFHDDD